MLLKIERKVLRKTVKSSECSISLSEIGNYNGEYVYQAFLSLKEKGYFTIVSSSINREMFKFTLSSKGRFYKEHLFLSFLRNIIIPFVVSLITATATYHLEKVADSYSDSRPSQCTYELNQCSDPRF
jgi:hypothetical protein|nr:MAG TPA: hypothetical protein [Bacteriophage sp.]